MLSEEKPDEVDHGAVKMAATIYFILLFLLKFLSDPGVPGVRSMGPVV